MCMVERGVVNYTYGGIPSIPEAIFGLPKYDRRNDVKKDAYIDRMMMLVMGLQLLRVSLL